MVAEHLDVTGIERLGHHRQTRSSACFVEQRQSGNSHPLERPGAGAGLEDATAEDTGTGPMSRHRVLDVAGLDGARSGDDGDRVTADDCIADPDSASGVTMYRAWEQRLYGHRKDPPCGDGPPHGIRG
jgi:hypothetical protein